MRNRFEEVRVTHEVRSQGRIFLCRYVESQVQLPGNGPGLGHSDGVRYWCSSRSGTQLISIGKLPASTAEKGSWKFCIFRNVGIVSIARLLVFRYSVT